MAYPRSLLLHPVPLALALVLALGVQVADATNRTRTTAPAPAPAPTPAPGYVPAGDRPPPGPAPYRVQPQSRGNDFDFNFWTMVAGRGSDDFNGFIGEAGLEFGIGNINTGAAMFPVLRLGIGIGGQSYEHETVGGEASAAVISLNVLGGFGWRAESDLVGQFGLWLRADLATSDLSFSNGDMPLGNTSQGMMLGGFFRMTAEIGGSFSFPFGIYAGAAIDGSESFTVALDLGGLISVIVVCIIAGGNAR